MLLIDCQPAQDHCQLRPGEERIEAHVSILVSNHDILMEKIFRGGLLLIKIFSGS